MLAFITDESVLVFATDEATLPDAVRPPGRFPPSRPLEGDTDGGPGHWVTIRRSGEWVPYQGQISGVPRTITGETMEYRVPYDPLPDEVEDHVDFDGHEWRGDPPQEIFLDAKEKYESVFITPKWDKLPDKQLKKFEKQAARQVRALEQNGSAGRIEWHFSNEEVADIVRDYFNDNGIEVTVVYTPEK